MKDSHTSLDHIDQPFVSSAKVLVHRLIFFGVALVFNLVAVLWLIDLFWRMGFQKAHIPMLIIFAILNGILVLGSLHALCGFYSILRGRKRSVRITKLAEGIEGKLSKRHAVVMPIYNEDSRKVCARVEAIHRSIEATGHLESYDFFIISDTRDLDLWVLEEVAWTNLCRKLEGFGRIYYRRRKLNQNRKAGNISDFVRKWGGHYETMLVLDADSLMDGADVVKMTRVMEAYPRLGILQTAPKLIRGESLFTRLQQFTMRLYSPLFIRGLNFWQLGGGSYWGHNALIRVKPFSEFCELPGLPGKEPFGGRILSHDFVEAALMVAEGWEVWLAWDIEGSYEEAPPSLVDHLIRDRRWCQGNLQHTWLLFSRNLTFSVRVHLLVGIMAYLGSPLWFLFLLLGTWIAWDRFTSELSQLPFESYAERWFQIEGMQQNLILVAMVVTLLFSPKILAVLRAILNKSVRKSFGGVWAIVAGFVCDVFISMLLAPCIMVAHTLMVVSIVLGNAVGWESQNRESDGTTWRDALRFHAVATILGIIWAALAWHISHTYALWMAPILIGLILATPVSVLTSRARYGKTLLRYQILATPEELHGAEVIQLADEAIATQHLALDASLENRYGFIAAVVDPYVNGVHVSLLDQQTQNSKSRSLAERCLSTGLDEISQEELSRIMYSAQDLLFMHRSVWLRSDQDIHEVWKHAVDSYRAQL
ncbi:MAG: glucans biosynthesis glucosyltransferase MdoH [Akkermansiaceae bacterium]